MKFWDSSVFVSVLVAEAGTSLAKRWLKTDSNIWAWTMSPVEIASALERRAREKTLSASALHDAKTALAELWQSVSVVKDAERVKERAIRLLALHPLRAADACQLAAALVATSERPQRHAFHCFDDRLLLAAGKEGFQAFGLK